MGYMGFGMRKEDYKRKPKGPFKKLKDLYGNDTPKVKHSKDAPELTREEVLHEFRFKSIHDLRFWGFIKVSMLLLFLSWIVYSLFLEPWFKKRKFERITNALIEQYNEDYEFLLSTGTYFKRFEELKIDTLGDISLLLNRNVNYFFSPAEVQDSLTVKIFGNKQNAEDFNFDGKSLKVVRKDSVQDLNTMD